MRRLLSQPRPYWQQVVESQGMYFHSPGQVPYWDESVYYEFSAAEVDELERATNWLNEACLKAAEHIIANDLFDRVGVPPAFVDFVRQSWERDECTVYGRFDFCYDGHGPPALLEFNADTPTALLEAAVIQWYWLKDIFPGEDQFNSIHERLVEVWKRSRDAWGGEMVFTALAGNLEDYMTVNYLRDTAMQAGWPTQYLDLEAIGFHYQRRLFVDTNDRPIRNLFKLYPWEWLMRDRFAPHLLEHRLKWLEAPWKMLLSNKALLVILHELFRDSPYLLRASFEPLDVDYVKKPIHGREGSNIEIVAGGQTILQTGGPYGGPFVYQELRKLPNFDGNFPAIGSWLVNGYACGIGIREDKEPVTSNTSRFVPHLIRATKEKDFSS
jgi:glutathionylspermidine synthase